MTNNELNEFILRINRICFGQDFRFFIVSKNKSCPNGLTYDVTYDEETGKYCFILMTKIYGYDSSSNNGISRYSDASDYYYGDDVTPELEEYAEEFFKERHPEIYNDPKFDFHSSATPKKIQLFMDSVEEE